MVVVGSWLRASSTPTRPVASSAPPSQSTRPPGRWSVSGRKKNTAAAATATENAGTHRAEVGLSDHSMTSPEATAPTPVPTLRAAIMMPIPKVSLLSGPPLFRSAPTSRGKKPDRAPWSVTPTSSSSKSRPRATSSDPAITMPKVHSRTRRWPYMSPRRDRIETQTALESRLAMLSQFSWAAVTPKVLESVSSRGLRKVWSEPLTSSTTIIEVRIRPKEVVFTAAGDPVLRSGGCVDESVPAKAAPWVVRRRLRGVCRRGKVCGQQSVGKPFSGL